MNFTFATAGQILFGPGTLSQAGALAAELGSRALLVGGRNRARLQPLEGHLTAHGVSYHAVTVAGEPTVSAVLAILDEARTFGADLVIAMGGGSVLDAGKAVSALLTNPGDPLDYLEVVGRGLPLFEPAAPLIAIPTTAGTGSEVTRNAVLSVPDKRVKVSMRSPLMLPRVALVDPELTHELPPELTASTGLDALTQCLEPFVSPRANPLTDAFCREGLRRAAGALRRAYHQPDAAAREEMALVSLLGGLALANAKLGAVHGFAGPLGGMLAAPHGQLCAALLAPVTRANIAALRARGPAGASALERYREAAVLLTGRPDAGPDDAVRWLEELVRELKIAPLGALGLQRAQIAEAVEKAQRSSSMKGNPVTLDEAELAAVLEAAL